MKEFYSMLFSYGALGIIRLFIILFLSIVFSKFKNLFYWIKIIK